MSGCTSPGVGYIAPAGVKTRNILKGMKFKTMNKKMSKRQKDIKSKLMAAICMLLVSSIMMVSSTYAWFTLSTAPEVTGIQTAVGANGNLEMALQPYSGVLSEINTGESDSTKLPLERNVTWGNLVDVSDNASYGMNNIVLYPAALNIGGDGKIGEQPLKTPVYGADGRVSKVDANTTTGAYDYIKGQFSESMTIGEKTYGPDEATGVAKGVRAIGRSSGLSARELAHRNAIAAAVAEKGGANTDAGKTLNTNGPSVGNIAVKYATGTTTFTQEDIAGLKAAVTDLNNIANRIEKSLKSYLLAHSIAPASAETTYVDLVTAINGAATLEAAEQVTGAIVPTDAAYTTAKTQLGAMRDKLTSANAVNSLTGDSIAWADLSGPLSALVNMDGITVNTLTIDQIRADGGQDLLFDKLMETNYTAQIRMPSGTGIFADIADFTGSYSASFRMSVALDGRNIPVNAEMYAVAGEGTAYLDAVKSITTMAFSEGTGNTSTAKPIDTYYGYILDLAFRTNAANSYLQLQADAVNRIYDGNDNPETMGHGANMKFKTDSASFGQAGVKALMEHVRIVFFNTADNSIIAYAKLDNTSVTNEGDYVVMPIVMTNSDFVAITDDEGTTDVDESIKIMELPQNEAKALSVMVYLDGNTMTNADVAADAAQSMYGTMNLQFSSSADLVPMDYADLKTEGTGTSTSYSPLNKMSVPSGYRYTAYTDGSKIGFALTAPAGVSLDAATVKVEIVTGTDAQGAETKTAPITATSGSMGSMSGYVVDIPEDVTVDSNTKIYITVEGATESNP